MSEEKDREEGQITKPHPNDPNYHYVLKKKPKPSTLRVKEHHARMSNNGLFRRIEVWAHDDDIAEIQQFAQLLRFKKVEAFVQVSPDFESTEEFEERLGLDKMRKEMKKRKN